MAYWERNEARLIERMDRERRTADQARRKVEELAAAQQDREWPEGWGPYVTT